MSRSRVAIVVLVVAAGLLVGAAPAGSQSPDSRRVELDRTQILAGERVDVTLVGFTGRSATLSVCGNLAKRGSGDCNMVASQGIGIEAAGPTVASLVVSTPPAPCPCVVRAMSNAQDQVTIAPFQLVGAPTAPVVEPVSGDLVSVAVRARPSPRGLVSRLRSALGGPTPFEVTVRVRNRTAAPVPAPALVASWSRSGSGRQPFDLPAVGPLDPGEEDVATTMETVRSPVLGTYTWDVRAVGAGPAVRATHVTRRIPQTLLVLGAVLTVDLAIMALRARRRRASSGRGTPAVGSPHLAS